MKKGDWYLKIVVLNHLRWTYFQEYPMKCPQCQASHGVIQSGFQKNHQRYHGKSCLFYSKAE